MITDPSDSIATVDESKYTTGQPLACAILVPKPVGST